MNDPKTRKKNALIAQQVNEKRPNMKELPARPIQDGEERVRICRLLMPKQPLNG